MQAGKLLETSNGNFTIVRLIRTTLCGELYQAYWDKINDSVGLKISRIGPFAKIYENPLKEAELLQQLSTIAMEIGVVFLHAFFREMYHFKTNEKGEAEEAVFMVMEYLAGSTALDFVNEEISADHYQLANVYDLPKKDLLRQMTRLMEYLHQHKFVHLDFTLENLMFRNSQVVAIDFGLGQFCPETFDVGIFSGKRIYLPPETYASNPTYDGRKRDIWSLGVCCYTLYTGRYLIGPDDKVEEVCMLLKSGLDSYLEIHYPLGISWPVALKDFMASCLNVNPKKRLSAEELLEHPWIKEKISGTSKFFSSVGKTLKHAVTSLLNTRNTIFMRGKNTSSSVTPINQSPPTDMRRAIACNSSPQPAQKVDMTTYNEDNSVASPGTQEFHRTMNNMKNIQGLTVVNSPSQYKRVAQFAQNQGPSPASRIREIKPKEQSTEESVESPPPIPSDPKSKTEKSLGSKVPTSTSPIKKDDKPGAHVSPDKQNQSTKPSSSNQTSSAIPIVLDKSQKEKPKAKETTENTVSKDENPTSEKPKEKPVSKDENPKVKQTTSKEKTVSKDENPTSEKPKEKTVSQDENPKVKQTTSEKPKAITVSKDENPKVEQTTPEKQKEIITSDSPTEEQPKAQQHSLMDIKNRALDRTRIKVSLQTKYGSGE